MLKVFVMWLFVDAWLPVSVGIVIGVAITTAAIWAIQQWRNRVSK